MTTKKLKFTDPITWEHHRSGWKWIVSHMQEKFHNPDGVLTHVYYEDAIIRGTVIEEPFIGFIHGTPTVAPYTSDVYWTNSHMRMSLEQMLEPEWWQKCTPNCLGLFVFSQYTKRFIEAHTSIPVEALVHPTLMTDKHFSMDRFLANPDKKFVLVGHWQRRFQDIFDIPVTRYGKYILQGGQAYFPYERLCRYGRLKPNQTVGWWPRLNDNDYDDFLTENIVFLPLHDCAACNTLVECVVRGTPVAVPKVGGVIETLGEDYPLYYSTLEEAARKVEDYACLEAAHVHLKGLDKTALDIDYFLNSLERSSLYRNLREFSINPAVQGTQFVDVEVALV